GCDAAWRPFLLDGGIVPQELRQTLDALQRRMDNKDIGSTEKRFGRHLEWNEKRDCRSRSDRPQNLPDARVSSHVVIARAPAEDKVTGARKLRLQRGQRAGHLPRWQADFRVPAAPDDINDLGSRPSPGRRLDWGR